MTSVSKKISDTTVGTFVIGKNPTECGRTSQYFSCYLQSFGTRCTL